MTFKLATVSAVILTLAMPALAQTSGTDPAATMPSPSTVPGATGSSTVTPPPGVTDPTATNSTTGTVDHEDHCQQPGTPTNTNPSAETTTLPRTEPACQ